MLEHLFFQHLQLLKVSGGGLENTTVPNILTTYEDRPSLALSHLLVMYYRAGCRKKVTVWSHGGMKQLLFFFAEVLGGQRCWTGMRKSLKMGAQTRLLEQSLCWSPELTLRLSPWAGGMWGCRTSPESSPVPQHQRMMPKARKSVCSIWCDAFHSGAPATAGALGHCGSSQI